MKFSIITCTYNPDIRIFKCLVEAINKLKTNDRLSFEWIIVDNNSEKPICEIGYINNAIKSHTNYNILDEACPGLTNARITGIKKSKYDWIIFFDDDNVPNNDYLLEAAELINKNTDVACWGPGTINVEYTECKPSKWLLENKHIFQERITQGDKTTNSKHWNDIYPAGTGLVIKKDQLLNYILFVERGKYNLIDRNGQSLSSGGDTQIIFNLIKNGYYAGVSGSLCLNHLINSNKTKLTYLTKLFYLTNSSYLTAYNEVYINNNEPIVAYSSAKIVKMSMRWFREHAYSKINIYLYLSFIGFLGKINRNYATSVVIRKPFFLKIIDKIIL